MTKIGIVIGHNTKAQGAVRATDGRTEYDWNGDLAAAIAQHLPPMYRVFRRHPIGYSAEIRQVYAEADAWGADATIELHFNAAGVGSTGTETLHSGSSGSVALAKEVQAGMLRALGLRNRGMIERKRGSGRGWESLHAGRAPAVLIEPYFGSNPKDCAAADAGFERLASEIHVAAQTWARGRL